MSRAAFDDFLNDVEEYLEAREDVRDGDDGRPRPNKAMNLLVELRGWRLELQKRSGEAVERDAARYRWLRNSHNQGANSPTAEGIIVCTDRPAKEPRYIGPLAWQLLDAAIDAAMQSSRSEGSK